MKEVRCNFCAWEGTNEDLEILHESTNIETKERHFVKVCPYCKSDDYLIDIWDVDLDEDEPDSMDILSPSWLDKADEAHKRKGGE